MDVSILKYIVCKIVFSKLPQEQWKEIESQGGAKGIWS